MRSGFAARPWLIVPVCIGIHMTCAIAYLIDPAVAKITAMHLPFVLFGSALWVVLIAASVSAAIPMALAVSAEWVHWLLWPQQALLILSAISAIVATYSGVYPDGYKASSQTFIAADQCVYVYLMLAHLAAVIRNARMPGSI